VSPSRPGQPRRELPTTLIVKLVVVVMSGVTACSRRAPGWLSSGRNDKIGRYA